MYIFGISVFTLNNNTKSYVRCIKILGGEILIYTLNINAVKSIQPKIENSK